MSLGKEMVTFNDELYWVYRKVKAEIVKDAETIKQFWHCDIALRHGEQIFFCRHIPKVEPIYEENN